MKVTIIVPVRVIGFNTPGQSEQMAHVGRFKFRTVVNMPALPRKGEDIYLKEGGNDEFDNLKVDGVSWVLDVDTFPVVFHPKVTATEIVDSVIEDGILDLTYKARVGLYQRCAKSSRLKYRIEWHCFSSNEWETEVLLLTKKS
jgi:hypothetical protein